MVFTYEDAKYKLYDRVGIKNMSKYLKKLHCKPSGVIINHKSSWRKNKYMVLLKGCHESYWYYEYRLWKLK